MAIFKVIYKFRIVWMNVQTLIIMYWLTWTESCDIVCGATNVGQVLKENGLYLYNIYFICIYYLFVCDYYHK